MRRRDLDILTFPTAIWLLILDPQVRDMDLVVEVGQVVVLGPARDFFRRPIGMSVIVVAVAIALVQPRLVFALQLVVQDDSPDACATLLKALCFAFVGAIDLGVVFELPLAFEIRIERLLMVLVAVTVALEKAPPLVSQDDRLIAVTGHAYGLDQRLLAKMPQVSGTGVGRSIVVVSEVAT
jgi:hypothetical protein